MNIAQHLVWPLLLILGSAVNAQEAARSKAPEAVLPSIPEAVLPNVPDAALSSTTEEAPSSNVKETNLQNSTTEEPEQTSTEAEQISTIKPSLLKSAMTKDFNKALYFDQIDNGLILPPLELDYDLFDQGKQLRMGNVILSEKSFFFELRPLGRTHPQLNQVVSNLEAQKLVLVMAWPEPLLSFGTLEMISRRGSVLWRTHISPAKIFLWKQKLESWRKILVKAGTPAASLHDGIFAAQYAILNIETASAFINAKESFRLCLSQEQERSPIKLCSQRYAMINTSRGLTIAKAGADKPTARILINNDEAPLKKTLTVTTDTPIGFYSELATGESYEFVTVPSKLQLMDIADTNKEKVLRIVGYDARPVNSSVLLNSDQYTSLTKMLGFEATISDPRKFWAALISTDDPKIYLPGNGGGIFKQKFKLSEIPRRQSRAYLHRQTPAGTYSNSIQLEGRKQETSVVASTQDSVTTDEKDPNYFYWQFQAKERGQINRSYLNVNFEGQTYKSYYEIYKGFPRELSARLSTVAASGSLIFLGELAYSQWFEDLFGWTNYYVSRQRWGFSAKYFQSFNELKVDLATGQTAKLTVANVDLKYRLIPGLWNRDETLGILASYQNVALDQLKAPMLGVGVFWARSMPKAIDDIFNFVEIMRHPKWVDLEFIYYMKSMNSNVTLDSSMSLNFHGKVLWAHNVFGEAGFGLKRYAFTDTMLNQMAGLNTVYGTAGIGLNF